MLSRIDRSHGQSRSEVEEKRSEIKGICPGSGKSCAGPQGAEDGAGKTGRESRAQGCRQSRTEAGGQVRSTKPASKPTAPVAIKAGKWVYTFGDGKAEGKAELRDLLGGKGANLAEMANLGLPVPPGFTIPTSVCTYFYANDKTYPKELKAQVEKALDHVGKLTGKVFGDAGNPLLVSVRSGARASMPGMMDTVLNLGLNDQTVEALAELSGDRRFAYDSYRRFITMYSDVVLGFEHHHFEDILDTFKDGQGYSLDTDLSAEDWVELVGKYKEAVARETGKEFPQDPHDQLWGAIGAVFFILDERARDDLSQAARHSGIVGHRGQRAGHGVRQHGRHVGDRRCLHAQSLDRRDQALWRVPDQRAGRGRGRGHPHPAGHLRGCADRVRLRQGVDGNRDARRIQRADADLHACSKSITATCRTWSSRSSAASCGCCRPAPASAPPRQRCASRSNSPMKA